MLEGKISNQQVKLMRKLLTTGLFIFLFFSFQAHAQNTIIRSLSPSQVEAGATAFPLVVSGSNFAKNARVEVNGVALDTVSLAWNKLRATVPANLAATAGTLEVRVVSRNRPSNAINLTVSGSPVGNYNWTALTAKLNGFISNQTPLPPDKVRGLTFMLSRHGKVIYSQSFGNQTLDSVLPIASSTKMPSGMAVLSLVDEGRLNLDTPISIYLQGYATVPADKANITVRMLFNHTSGLSQEDCLGNVNSTLQACVQEILNTPLSFAPGTRFAYGGSSMQVAGGVVEAITGESWNAYFSRKIAQPLGLTSFTYGNTNNPRIAGGASSDVGDYTRLMQAYLSGGVYGNTRILSRNMYVEMQTDQKRDLPVLNSPGGNTLTGYSYGWWHTSPAFLQQQPQPQTIGLELSDQGAFGCTPWIDLEYNYTAIILIQRQTSTGTAIWNEIRPLIIEQMRNNQ
jgi:CubicO group peptidase (beta-lactamase class C family)